MKYFSFLGLLLACLTLSACGGLFPSSSSSSSTPMAAGSAVRSGDVMRTGDRVIIRLTGVPTDSEFTNEVEIPSSGEITVPLLTRTFHATGLTTDELATEITQEYRAEQIYTTPNVSVLPEERFVNVGGDVRSPSRVAYTSDLTLLSAINSCGGFTDYGNRRNVRILRGQQVIMVDAVKAARTPGADPVLYAGDQIYVSRTIF